MFKLGYRKMEKGRNLHASLVYMEPEMFGLLTNACLDSLKKADIESLGTVAFAIINPKVSSPCCKEFEYSVAFFGH